MNLTDISKMSFFFVQKHSFWSLWIIQNNKPYQLKLLIPDTGFQANILYIPTIIMCHICNIKPCEMYKYRELLECVILKVPNVQTFKQFTKAYRYLVCS